MWNVHYIIITSWLSYFTIPHQNLLLPSNSNIESTDQWMLSHLCLLFAVSPCTALTGLELVGSSYPLTTASWTGVRVYATKCPLFISWTESVHQNLSQQNICDFLRVPQEHHAGGLSRAELLDGFYCPVYIKWASIFFSTCNLQSSAPDFYYLS